jgi:hypothetical protein
MSVRAAQVRGDAGPSALVLLEESVHLLRRAPAADLAWYYAGGAPWVLGLLLFWAHCTWFTPAGDRLAWSTLLLVLLFGWLKLCQSVFAARLLARRLGAPLPVLRPASVPGLLLRELRVHTWGMLGIPVAALLTAPLGYVWTYYQLRTVTDARPVEEGKSDAWGLARLWPMQTHIGMSVLTILAIVAWLNLAICFFLLPYLANRFLGLDNSFSLSGWSFLNTTFLASSVASAWLVIDPLIKAYHVLRCYHGRARVGGEDLRELFQEGGARRRLLGLALVGGLLWGGAVGTPLHANEPAQARSGANSPLVVQPDSAPDSTVKPAAQPSPVQEPAAGGAAKEPRRVEAKSLGGSIERTLMDRDFEWRLRPRPQPKEKREEGPLVRFIRTGVEMVEEMGRSVKQAYKGFKRWWRSTFGGDEGEGPEPVSKDGGSHAGALLDLFTYGLGAVLLLLLGYLCFVVARQARRNARRSVLASPSLAPAATPDLEDEAVHAAQLPSDGWLALAREKLAAGEWRLAFRALYLAQLAHLSEQGLLTLARHKTNQDYERELRRRAPQSGDLLEAFGRRRRGFDAVWYGRGQVQEDEVRVWLGELERGGGQ